MMQHSPTQPPELPSYQLLDVLGQGGMGLVYRAKAMATGEHVAIKLLPEIPTNFKDEQLQRFEREIRIAKSLEHPTIVTVRESGQAGNVPFLVMDLVTGESLRQLISRLGTLDTEFIKHAATDLAGALDYMASKGVVHRDIKPENVLVGQDGRVKLTDFGISASFEDLGHLTTTGQFLGTVDYVAPEQRARLPVDSRADQYSFAVIVYEMLTGKRPLGAFKKASLIRPGLHTRVDEVLGKALQEDPDDRYPSAGSFSVDLRAALSLRPPNLRVRRLAVALALVGTLLSGVGGWIWSRERGRQANEKRLVEEESNITFLLQQAEKAQQAYRPRDALSFLNEAIDLAPNRVELRLKRALLYKQLSLLAEAFGDLDMALELEPANVDAMVGRGSVFVQMKEYGQAVPVLSGALSQAPNHAEALAYRGWSFHQLNRPEEAQRDLDSAILADPNCSAAYQFRGLRHRDLKEFRLADKQFVLAAQKDPQNVWAYHALADLLITCPDAKLRSPKRAVKCALEANKLTNGRDWRHTRLLARCLAADNRPADAAKWAERAMSDAPVTHKEQIRLELESYRKQVMDEGRKKSP